MRRFKKEIVIGAVGASVIGWTAKISQIDDEAYSEMQKLGWELKHIDKELEHFREIGGPSGIMEHQILWDYEARKARLEHSLQRYQKWDSHSFTRKHVSIPPSLAFKFY